MNFSIGAITEMAKRMAIVDFTMPFSYSVYDAIYTLKSIGYEINLTKPYDFKVWSLLSITLLCVTIVFFAILKITRNESNSFLIVSQSRTSIIQIVRFFLLFLFYFLCLFCVCRFLFKRVSNNRSFINVKLRQVLTYC